MSDLIERLRETAAERAKATAHDDPNNYLLVVARLSREDADLMAEAAAEIERLRSALAPCAAISQARERSGGCEGTSREHHRGPAPRDRGARRSGTVGMMAHSSLVIANEFIRRSLQSGCPITQMQVQKLVYFAHGWYLAVTGNRLVEDQVQAWDFGPVFPTLYSALRKFGRNPIDRVLRWGEDTPFNFDDAGEAIEVMAPEESAIIDQVWNAYGRFPAFKLSALTHEPGTPWEAAFEGGKNRPIADADIKSYFYNLMQAA